MMLVKRRDGKSKNSKGDPYMILHMHIPYHSGRIKYKRREREWGCSRCPRMP